MESYRIHAFVCTGKRCSKKGSEDVIDRLKDRVKADGLTGEVRISRSGCVKVCKETGTEGEYSPVVIVYPEGTWYRNVVPSEMKEIYEEHLKSGRPVECLVHFRLTTSP